MSDRAVQRGDEFGAFTRTAGAAVRRALVAYYGVEIGTEAAADALAVAWERWDSVSVMDNAAGYLFRIGQSKARPHVRWARRRDTFPTRDAGLRPEALPDADVLAALAKLSAAQRTAVVLGGVTRAPASPRVRWSVMLVSAAAVVALVVAIVVFTGRRSAVISPASTVTPSSLPADQVWCLRNPTGAQTEALLLEIRRLPACATGGTVMLVATNEGNSMCRSSQMATLGDGTRMWFISQSGFGGERGDWEPMPADVVDGEGVIEYPPSRSRAWPMYLPDGARGDVTFVLSVQCDDTTASRQITVPMHLEPSDVAAGVAIDDTFTKVGYYGACGNETLEFDGRTLYPLLPRQSAALDTDAYPLPPADANLGLRHVASRPNVSGPGPGDDIGTLVRYTDGIWRFESDSGRVIWLTEEPQTYNWEC